MGLHCSQERIKDAPKSIARVVAITHTVFHYRKEFHELVRDKLAKFGIDYLVIYGQPDRKEAKKSDTADLSFGLKIRNRYIYLSRSRNPLILQLVIRKAISADLTIVIQENRLILNYILQLLPRNGRLALFGHGRNYQSRSPNGVAEKWKRFWATKCDWWFGYTEETKQHLMSLGFPEDRITVFNNAVDTSALRNAFNELTPARLTFFREQLNIISDNVAIFVGGIYPDKRLRFLIDACDLIRAQIPDFALIVVGGGVDLPELQGLAKTRPWLKVVGPKFGSDKAALMRLGKIFLMPGLLGLAVLDAAAAALPTITTAFPWHSPEIAYLENGINGVVVNDWHDVSAYAEAVISLLMDQNRLTKMASAAQELSDRYTIDLMAERFATGVQKALNAAPR